MNFFLGLLLWKVFRSLIRWGIYSPDSAYCLGKGQHIDLSAEERTDVYIFGDVCQEKYFGQGCSLPKLLSIPGGHNHKKIILYDENKKIAIFENAHGSVSPLPTSYGPDFGNKFWPKSKIFRRVPGEKIQNKTRNIIRHRSKIIHEF